MLLAVVKKCNKILATMRVRTVSIYSCNLSSDLEKSRKQFAKRMVFLALLLEIMRIVMKSEGMAL